MEVYLGVEIDNKPISSSLVMVPYETWEVVPMHTMKAYGGV